VALIVGHPFNRRTSLLFAGLIAALTLPVYLRTMYPGLMGSGDTAKFQFLGRVLGTAHNPGYPFYVLLSHVFSYVPIGTLAYRINLLSVLAAVVAAMLMFFLAHRVGAEPVVAIATALAFAWSRTFWELSLRAEVYSVAAALLAGILLCLVRWQQTRRLRDLGLAISLVGVAVGHHLTVVMLLPAMAAFVLLTDARSVLRPKPIAICAAVAVLGASQYLFIVLRTHEHALYLESHASNLRELFDVMRGKQFSALVLGDPVSVLLGTRLPMILAAVGREFGVIGIGGLAVGIVSIVRRQPAQAVLLLGGAAGGLAFVTIYAVPDFEGFLVPIAVCLWPVAGLGIQQVAQTVVTAVVRESRFRTSLVAAAVLAAPAVAIASNYRANDHHRRTYETEYFRAFFEAPPAHTVILSEEYAVDAMVLYKLLGEGAARGRDIRYVAPVDPIRVREYMRQGYQVWVFKRTRQILSNSGFRFAPVQLVDHGVPVQMQYLPLFRVASYDRCAEIGNLGWVDVSDELNDGYGRVRIDNYQPFDASVTLLIASAQPIQPRVLGVAGYGVPTIEQGPEQPDEAFRQVPTLRTRLANPGDSGQNIRLYRLSVRINDEGQFATYHVDLGAVPLVAYANARVDLNNPRRATICSEPLAASPFFARDDQASVKIAMTDGETFFARGWDDIEKEPSGRVFRWMSAKESAIIAMLDRQVPVQVAFDALPLSRNKSPVTLRVSVNGIRAGEQRLESGWTRYEWQTPAAAWRKGLNEVVLQVSAVARPVDLGINSDTRTLGAAIADIELRQLRRPGR
jgi:hypothetical protein